MAGFHSEHVCGNARKRHRAFKRKAMKRPYQSKRRPLGSNVIAIDVDGTLVTFAGELNVDLVDWCRRKKETGKTLILWSARGEDYARRVADRFGLTELFDVITGKPEAIVDDDGWSWIRFTQVVTSLD